MNLFAFKGPEQPMRPELVTMRQLLESANTNPALVWWAMGVKDLIYDNARCFVLWTMGTGAKVARVKFSYNEEWDLYELEFYGHVADRYDTYADTLDADRSQVTQGQRNKVLAGIYVSDVIRTIEEHTGFCLSIYSHFSPDRELTGSRSTLISNATAHENYPYNPANRFPVGYGSDRMRPASVQPSPPPAPTGGLLSPVCV